MALGFLLSITATSAHADPASLALLPPRIESTTQSTEQVPSRGTSVLGVTASDPQGSALTFTWTSTEGALAPPVHGATTSEVTWTAPDCLPADSAPVKVAVTNAFGLTSEVAFTFNVGGDLSLDYQKPFEPSQFSEVRDVGIWPTTLRLLPKSIPLTSERIIFEEPVSLSLQLVRKNAGASHTLGWMYRDELVARGYVGPNDELLDTNNNGIADLHEDLYNLAPSTGPQARPYIGLWPRCPRSFFSKGLMYSEPGLAMNAGCQTTFRREMMADARPGQGHVRALTDVVGIGRPADANPNGFSDMGRYPRIPNLLEPALPENDFKGLGRLVFLITDDDDDNLTYNQMGPVQDSRSIPPDGIPDYDVSAYTPQGVLRPQNPDPGITPRDRKVAMGTLDAHREVVFFLVTYFEGIHEPLDAGLTSPCLRKAADGRCDLFLQTPVSVFFSKASWNMDMDVRGTSPAAEFAQGCTYRDTCDRAAPNSSNSCPLPGTTQRLCGWLDAQAQTMLRRPEYGNFILPGERLFVPASSNGAMPHLVVASSPAFPQRWLLGWEDLNGGGDRDFANAVFLLQAEPSGLARTVSLGAIPQDLDPRCFVSRVRLGKSDYFGPSCTATSDAYASYAVSPDCLLCSQGTCAPNMSPTWLQAGLGSGMSQTVMDVGAIQGQSLCWQVTLGTREFLCQPEVFNVDIGYELTRLP